MITLLRIIAIFAGMKKGLKIFLLIILSCCYFNTVFEFSDTEKKVNFENEAHTYINKEKVFLQNHLSIGRNCHADFILFSHINQNVFLSENYISNIPYTFQSDFLLEKIFLRNSVLRI